jgi:leucyl-tRNA synthetase
MATDKTLAVQINGKFCDTIATQDESVTEELLLRSTKVRNVLDGAVPVKIVVIPGKLANILTNTK